MALHKSQRLGCAWGKRWVAACLFIRAAADQGIAGDTHASPSRPPPALVNSNAEHAQRQTESQGGVPQDRSRLYIGIGRAELSRTEMFQVRSGPPQD